MKKKRHLMHKSVVFLCTLICLGIQTPSIQAQEDIQRQIDSLHTIFKSTPDDSSRIRIFNFLSWYHDRQKTDYNIDSALYWVDKAIELMTKPENIDMYNYAYFQGALIASKNKDFPRETDYYLKYLDAARTTKNKNWEGDALASLCRLFYELKDFDRADKYAEELERVISEMDNNRLKYSTLNKLGTYYKDKKENELALSTHLKAMEIALSMDAQMEISHSYNNIGLVYKNMEAYDDALVYYLKSIKIKEELNDKKGLAGSYINTAYIYNVKKEYRKAIDFAKTGLAFADEVNAYNFKMNGLQNLFDAYFAIKMYEEAAKTAIELMELMREIYDQNIVEQTRDLERKYESEKNKKDLEILKKEADLQDLEIVKQRDSIKAQERLITVFGVGLSIVLILSFFLVKSLYQRKKANQLLAKNFAVIQSQKEQVESQKSILQEKNQEILASINYAKRIQDALLPHEQQINQLITENFVYYVPKDIVAGDFYWVEQQDNSIYVAAADCTGHGVPGAMVSVICCNGLNKSLREYQLKKPDELLNKTRDEVIKHFQKSEQSVNDGMDISLIRIKKSKTQGFQVQFSGAHNSLIVIRKGTNEILEISGDKQPIGAYINMQPFTLHNLELSEGDALYLLTDGYQDQFGGETAEMRANGGKKFKPSRIKELLLQIHHKQMAEQKSILENTFHTWKGELDQIDDVCVIGIRL